MALVAARTTENVAVIPRYTYNAAMQGRSHSGFLITCPFRREKSATKEAMDLISQSIEGFYNGADSKGTCASIPVDVNGEPDRQGFEKKRNDDVANVQVENKLESGLPQFSLVKLARNGIVFLSISSVCIDVVSILRKILDNLEAGRRLTPKWCHRILPIQATCTLEQDVLHRVVSELLSSWMKVETRDNLSCLKYAVAYNGRGILDKKAEGTKGILGRNDCIRIVAEALSTVIKGATVDLSDPEVVVVVELLPVVAVQDSSLCAVSVIPGSLMKSKPKLCIKPLIHSIPDQTSKKRKYTE